MAKDLPKKSPARSRRGSSRSGSPSRRSSDVPSLQLEVEARRRELAILADVAARLHGREDVQSILDQTLDSLVGGLGLRTAWIFLSDTKDGQLRLAAHRGVSPAYLDAVASRGLGECLCSQVFSSGQGVIARNTIDCPRMPMIGSSTVRARVS